MVRKVRYLGGFFPVVEQLVDRDFQSASEFLKRLDGRHGVPVLDPRDVATQESRPFFNFALRELFLFTQLTQTITDNHVRRSLRLKSENWIYQKQIDGQSNQSIPQTSLASQISTGHSKKPRFPTGRKFDMQLDGCIPYIR